VFLSHFLPGVWVTIQSDSRLDFVEVIAGLPECRRQSASAGAGSGLRGPKADWRPHSGKGRGPVLARKPGKRTDLRTPASAARPLQARYQIPATHPRHSEVKEMPPFCAQSSGDACDAPKRRRASGIDLAWLKTDRRASLRGGCRCPPE
jgi:hypothetical protein